MEAFIKKITYCFNDENEVGEEIEREWKNGWNVYNKGLSYNSYLYPTKKEIEITYTLK